MAEMEDGASTNIVVPIVQGEFQHRVSCQMQRRASRTQTLRSKRGKSFAGCSLASGLHRQPRVSEWGPGASNGGAQRSPEEFQERPTRNGSASRLAPPCVAVRTLCRVSQRPIGTVCDPPRIRATQGRGL